MSKFNLPLLGIFIYFIILQLYIVECRPHTQRIIVHGHEWTVPNEVGWEEGKLKLKLLIHFFIIWFLVLVLQEAEPIRHKSLTNCASSRECRLAAERLRQIFLKYPVSAKYYGDSVGNDYPSSDIDSIFKWG